MPQAEALQSFAFPEEGCPYVSIDCWTANKEQSCENWKPNATSFHNPEIEVHSATMIKSCIGTSNRDIIIIGTPKSDLHVTLSINCDPSLSRRTKQTPAVGGKVHYATPMVTPKFDPRWVTLLLLLLHCFYCSAAIHASTVSQHTYLNPNITQYYCKHNNLVFHFPQTPNNPCIVTGGQRRRKVSQWFQETWLHWPTVHVIFLSVMFCQIWVTKEGW